MELRSFIKQAITDIVGGVTDAQGELPDGCVVPKVTDNYKSVETGISAIQGIHFEVVVRAEQTRGSEARLSVFTAVIGTGIKGESGEGSGHTAKLQFKVPIRFQHKNQES